MRASRSPSRFVFHLAAWFANQNSVDHPRDDLHTRWIRHHSLPSCGPPISTPDASYASAGCSIAGHGITVQSMRTCPVSLNLDTPYQITEALGRVLLHTSFDPRSRRCAAGSSTLTGRRGAGLYPERDSQLHLASALHAEPQSSPGTGEERGTSSTWTISWMASSQARWTPSARGEALNLATGVQTRIIDLAEW